MQEGVNVSNAQLIEVLNSRLGAAAVREAHMEAAIQQLLQDQGNLSQELALAHAEVSRLNKLLTPDVELPTDESADIHTLTQRDISATDAQAYEPV